MTLFKNKMFFVMQTDETGKEIYISDGSTANTSLFKDILVGSGSSNPSNFTVADDLLFFTAVSSGTGIELWQTDGTASGTKLVYDIASGSSSSSPKKLYYSEGKLFFTANDGINGYELWMHDIATNTTSLIKDIYSGSKDSDINNMVYYNGYYYFSAVDGLYGNELWRTDGTTNGTSLFLDIYQSIYDLTIGSTPQNLLVFDNKLYFTADDVTHGRELLYTDGTIGNYKRLIDLNKMPNSSSINKSGVSGSYYKVLNNYLFFYGTNGTNSGLWVTNGDSASTKFLLPIGFWDSAPISVKNNIYITGYNSNDGQVYTSDGTIAGTFKIGEINPGGTSYPKYLTEYKGDIYMSAYDGVNTTIKRYNGVSISNAFNYDYTQLNPSGLVVYNDKLYFFASSGFINNITYGDGLWSFDSATQTSVEDANYDVTTFDIYPNPVIDNLYFDTKLENGNAELFDLTGHKILAFTINQKYDVSNLKQGVYILSVNTLNGFSHKFKITKQ